MTKLALSGYTGTLHCVIQLSFIVNGHSGKYKSGTRAGTDRINEDQVLSIIQTSPVPCFVHQKPPQS